MKKVLIVLVILILLAIIGVVVWLFLKGTFSPGFNELSPAQPKVDKSKAVTKNMGPAGGVLVTDYNGTLITLTVPPDSLTVNYNITLAPLTEVPIKGYKRPDMGLGAVIDASSNLFGRPAYLTFQFNTPRPELTKSGAAEYDRCQPASRGFDPEICAGNNKVPFGYGVEPGTVMIFSSTEEKDVALIPTIPTGLPNTVSAQVFTNGAYLPDTVKLKELTKLAQLTLGGASNLGEDMEAYSHIVAMGGDLKPHLEEIKDLKRSSSSYPRTIAQELIVADAIGDTKLAKEKLDEFQEEYDQNLDFIRGSFLPWMRYAALVIQLENGVGGKVTKKKTSFIDQAFAGPLDELTEILIKDLKKQMEEAARKTLGDDRLSPREKVDAIKTMVALGGYDETDKEFFGQILGEAAGDAATLGEAEQISSLAEDLGFEDAMMKADARISDLLEKLEDCDLTKKTLKNYGVQECP